MILRTVHAGVGGGGQSMTEVIAKDARFKPIALIETHATTLRTAQYRLEQAGHKNVPGFSGLTGALSQLEADALVIRTPTRTHAELARLALVVGMHVLVEKPLTADWDDAKALVAEADSAWSKICVAQDFRYAACEQTITYILSKPDHPFYPGDVRIVDYVRHRHRPEPRNFDYPYAVVWEASCDAVDSLSVWLGPAKRVTARSYATPWSAYGPEANLSAFIEYARGAVCNYVTTLDATAPYWRVALQGERGTLELTDHERLRFHPKPAAQADAPAVIECDVMDCLPAEQCVLDDFFRHIVEGAEVGISGKQNLQTLAVCAALVKSAKDKRAVELAEIK
jgi:predicted dehydrogenase